MSEIIVLPESVVNKIAAGEVLNSPLNAVKEMLENSLDAGAKEVRVSIERGGLDKIEVEDDGKGIAALDLPLVCQRHATSKLCQFEDLKRMSTYGFRGEAMASISEVARVTVKTKTGTEPFAMMAIYKDGRIEGTPIRSSYHHPTGTSITVERIFRECDARLGSIKPPDEATRIMSLFYKYAIHRPDIKFRFSKKDGRGRVSSFQTDGTDDRHAVIEKLLCEKDLMDLEGADEEFHYSFHACFSRPKQLLTASSLQSKKDSHKVFHLFINHRPVECDSVKRAIDGAFKDQSKICQFMTMALKIDNNLIDVNVSPTKEKVHFLQERQIAQHIGQKFISLLEGFNKQHTFARLNFPVDSRLPEENATHANAIIPLGRKRAHAEMSEGAPTETASSVRNAYLDRSDRSVGLNVSRSKSQSDWRRRDPARRFQRLRVDYRERKLQEFFPREPISSYARLQEGLRLVHVKSDNLDDSGESVVDTVPKSVKVRDLRLNSIENLRRRVCAENDPGLRRLFSKLYFVGFLSTRQALFQHCEAETSCYCFFTAPVLREFFYQQVIFSFGNMGSYKLQASGGSNHAPVRQLLRLYMCSRTGSPDANEIERRVEVLSSNAGLLWDFFSIQLVEDGSGELILRSIPCLIRHPSAYVPPMVNIPRLLYDLSAVDYADEERCFEQVSRGVADFHVPVKLVEASRGVATTREEEAAETAELRVTNTDEKRRLQAAKDNMQYALFRRFQNKFLPPAKLRPFVRPIFGMRQACKLFHRC